MSALGAVNLSEQLNQRIGEAVALAEKARAMAAPGVSRFQVGAAVAVRDGGMFGGANIEYGGGLGAPDSRAIHAEESAIAAAVMAYGAKLEIELIAVRAAGVPVCCGNCLDALMTFSRPDTLIVAAGESETKLLSIEEALPSRFEPCPTGEGRELISVALRARDRGSQRFAFERSGAALLGASGRIFGGVRDDSISFHPVSAIESALAASRAAGEVEIKAAAYVSDSGHLCGRDRQKLFERALEISNLELPIYVHSIKHFRTERATASALLPYAFRGEAII